MEVADRTGKIMALMEEGMSTSRELHVLLKEARAVAEKMERL